MTTLQLLSQTDSRGQQEVSVVENPAGLPPEQISSTGDSHPALLGSEDLVRLAWRLIREQGYRAVSASIVDTHLSAPESDVAEEIASDLVQALRKPADWASTERAARRALDEYYVLSIELRDGNEQGRVRLSQRGVLTTDDPNQVKKLLQVLRGSYLS